MPYTCRGGSPIPSSAAKPPFQVIEHTADIGIIARGATLGELFANAAAGMFSIITELGSVRPRQSEEVVLARPALEDLLVAWLAELLYRFEVDNLVLSAFAVQIDDGSLRAAVRGEPVDPGRHPLHLGIKAVTYHRLEVAREDGGYRARVFFDI